MNDLCWKFDEGYTSVPWATPGLVQGTNGERDWIEAPYKSPIRNKDTVHQLCPVVGTIRTCCVDFIAQLRQQNLPIAKIDFFPGNRVGVWNETRMQRVSSAIRGNSHFAVLQTVLIAHSDRLHGHHPYACQWSGRWEVSTREEEGKTKAPCSK